jgi:L-malate glycosyltransferase
MTDTVRILHAHSTFSLGGKEARAVRLMNAFGGAAEHVVLSGVPDQLGAREAIERGIAVSFPNDAPSLTGKPSVGRFEALARYARGFDLLLTYNWGAMDMVMARRLFGGPPLVHHEDGFNQDEAVRLNRGRNLFRRIALRGCHALVVPSERLERIALKEWRQPRGRVRRIANGIPVDLCARAPVKGALKGFHKKADEVVIGTVAGLRPVKDLGRLVRAVAALPAHVRLVIVGEGPERERLAVLAAELGVSTRVLLTGFADRPWRWIGGFDIFALSSLSEQFPISLVEAMAAGLPAVATDVGDVAAMVAAENRPFIVPQPDGAAFVAALGRLAGDAGLRAAIGAANRAKALQSYDEKAMIGAYARIYGEAIGRVDAFGR